MNSKILVTLLVLFTGKLFSQIPANVLGQKYFLSSSFLFDKASFTKVASLSFSEDQREDKRLGTTEVPIKVVFIQDLKEYYLTIFSLGGGYYMSADEKKVELYFFSPDGKIYLICPGQSLDALEHYCVLGTDKKAVKEISQDKIKEEVLAVVKGYKELVVKKYKPDGNLVLYKNGPPPAAPTVNGERNFSAEGPLHGRLFIQNPTEKLFKFEPLNYSLPCKAIVLDRYLRPSKGNFTFEIKINNLSSFTSKQIDFDIKNDSKTINYTNFWKDYYSSSDFNALKGSGIHTIVISVIGVDGASIATVNFELDGFFEDINSEVEKNYPLFRKIPISYLAYKGKFTDPQLSAESIKRMIFDAYTDVASINKVFIGNTGTDWDVYKNNLGAIVNKYADRVIWVAGKNKDGNCFLAPVDIFRSYSGGGAYEAPYAKLSAYHLITCTDIK